MAIRKGLKIAAGAVLFALVMWGVLATPGFLTDVDSSVPVLSLREALR